MRILVAKIKEVKIIKMIGDKVVKMRKIDFLSNLLILNLYFLSIKLKRIKKGNKVTNCLRINFKG